MLQDVSEVFFPCPFRVGLVFSEYLLSGQVPSVKEVNDEEPLFFDLSLGGSSKVSQCYFSIVQLTILFSIPTIIF